MQLFEKYLDRAKGGCQPFNRVSVRHYPIHIYTHKFIAKKIGRETRETEKDCTLDTLRVTVKVLITV